MAYQNNIERRPGPIPSAVRSGVRLGSRSGRGRSEKGPLYRMNVSRSSRRGTTQTIHATERTASDGTLTLRVPLGQPDTEFEVVVVVQPKAIKRLPSPLNFPMGRGFSRHLQPSCSGIADFAAIILATLTPPFCR